MNKRNEYEPLWAELVEAYTQRFPQSAAVEEKGRNYLIDGGSHALRLSEPFSPRIQSAEGAWLTSEEGEPILDFWQGHLAHVLGHNPVHITATLARAFSHGQGLQTGFPDRLQVETAELLCRQAGAERVRFTTSGTLATMYAMLLARAFTGRDLIMKVGGGWHGGQPWALKGVNFKGGESPYQHAESEGLPAAVTGEVVVTRFNDPQSLADAFAEHGDRLACFIVEPIVGAKGTLPASREYLQTARELTQKYGALLILDEVISGFRFRAGDAGALYGVKPDLATFGKIIGGGMPVSAVAGRADILALAGRQSGHRVSFSGGTFSAHPASLLAARAAMGYLVENEGRVYPRLAELGEQTRRAIEAAFAGEGVYACCTGDANEALPGSSMFMVHFPYQTNARLERPEDVYDPAVCDVTLGQKVLQLALMLENILLVRSHGVVTVAHTAEDVAKLGEACRRVARRLRASS